MLSNREKRVVELICAGGKKGLTCGQQKPVYFQDGRIVLVRKDGTLIAHYPNGRVVEELSDGTVRDLTPCPILEAR